jgi:hypothetical protein
MKSNQYAISDHGVVSLTSSAITIVTANQTSLVGQKLVVNPSSTPGVGLASNTTSADASSTGFSFFGSILFWASSSGQIQSGFSAEPIGTVGDTWLIKWTSGNSVGNDTTVPLAIKKSAPGKLAKTST